MVSDAALRLYTVSQELREPMPPFSDDDVLDFMVREALAMRGMQARKDQNDKQKRDEWKRRPVGSGLGAA